MRWTTILTSASTLTALACGGAANQPPGSTGSPATTPTTPTMMVGTTAPASAAGAPAKPVGSALPTTPTMQIPSIPAGAAGSPGAAMNPVTMQPSAAGGAAVPPAGVMDEGCLKCRIPKECQGLPLEGMQYSPGGTTLPSKCRPYHPTTNNPYAVRCIDAMPNFKTKYPGDEFCILPPPPDKGVQVGLHPQGNSAAYWKAMWAGDMSGYETPKTEWVLKPGDEITQNYRSKDAGNKEMKNYYRTYFRMRSGSHHMIVTLHDSTDADGWIPGVGEALPGMFDPSSGSTLGILGGEQRPDDGTPISLEKPAEDAGLYLTFPADPSIIFNMHHFNTTDGPMLREGWINIWWEDDAKTRVNWYMGLDITQVAALGVSPGQTQDLHYSFSVGQDMRLVRVFGHRHFWTTNFSAWIKRKDGGANDIVYQSFDWFDMPTYRYDSATMNPPINTDKRLDGAMSGIVMLKAGDEFHFNCHIEFTDARKATDSKAPSPSQIGTLRFANEAYNGEMCINFGNVVGALGLPGGDSSAVPDFAKVGRSAPAPTTK
jgi:hypothetical protein